MVSTAEVQQHTDEPQRRTSDTSHNVSTRLADNAAHRLSSTSVLTQAEDEGASVQGTVLQTVAEARDAFCTDVDLEQSILDSAVDALSRENESRFEDPAVIVDMVTAAFAEATRKCVAHEEEPDVQEPTPEEESADATPSPAHTHDQHEEPSPRPTVAP